MFCMTEEPHHHTPRVLRSFRSHRSLKAADAHRQQPALQITHVSYNHVRQGSQSSSTTRSSIESEVSRPSTSRTDVSSTSSASTIEWDPLRLHPTTAPASAAPLPERRSHHELRGVRSFHKMPSHHASFRSLQSSRNSELEIHEGFDFGFKSQTFQASEYLEPARPPVRSAWSYSTVPSPGSSGDSDTGAGDLAGPEWGDDAVTPRPHAPTDDGDYFMKRGAWKRRGIVFSPGIVLAGEDESFDLDP